MPATFLLDHVPDLAPATICQLFYVLGAATVLAIAATPESVQRRLTEYGARSGKGTGEDASESCLDTSREGLLARLAANLTSVGMVPHSWFTHFYLLSVFCSLFWAFQYRFQGTALDFIVRAQATRQPTTMGIGQVILTWFLMLLQGSRRLYECLAVLRPSSSRMWIAHWLLGMAFYLCTSIAIWIEGSSSLRYKDQSSSTIEVLPMRPIICTPVFLVAWYMQYRCHNYLAGLEKYSLPNEGLFRYLACPHYTCECLLYLSLAVIAAPQDHLFNKTLLCAVLFTSVNLGVTASGTKKWYSEKFGPESVKGIWKMIPCIF